MTLSLSRPDPVPDLGTIRLSGHGTTVTAADLQIELVAASDYSASTAIDAADYLSVGQAVLQLLIAARREAGERDHDFRFIDASVAFSDRVERCRLADMIGLDAGKDPSQ